jgi:cephalosporin hydroxylase
MFKGKYDLSRRDGRMIPPTPPGIITGQRVYELAELARIYQALKPKYVVEIGTWHGGTLYHWLKYAQEGAHIVSVDLGSDQWGPPEPDFDTSQWFDWCPDHAMLHTITGNSTNPDTISQVSYLCPEIDFLFIDGDHSYEGARADFEIYGPKVRKGGVIAFHDLITPLGQPHIQVGKLWSEIQKAGYVTREIFSEPNQTSMGIGVILV